MLVPDTIDTKFLKEFKAFILKRTKKGDQFVIVAGGGSVAREYLKAMKVAGAPNPIDLDWLGIHITRVNAQLLHSVLRSVAYHKLIKNPNQAIPKNAKVVLAGGWKPGRSTDNIATLLARNVGAKEVINVSNIKYVYDKDPRKHKNAKPIKEMSWRDFRKLVGNKWDPGLHVPFDPIASKVAQKENMKVYIVGKNLKNIENLISGKKFIGTTLLS